VHTPYDIFGRGGGKTEAAWNSLPIATVTVERCFSAMKLLKSALRNKMGDDYMRNSLICYIETELLDKIPNEVIVEHFHARNRRGIKRKAMFSGFLLVLAFSFEFDIFLHYRLEIRNCIKKTSVMPTRRQV
jgi:hypothetical protein